MMKRLLALLSRGASPRAKKAFRRRALTLEQLEDRVALAGNILATVAGPYPQYLFQEYTPGGSMVRAVNIPPTPGSSFDYARGLVEDPSGTVYVYNGTFTPYLAAYNPATNSWSQSTYAGWSTVSNVSYGGLAEFGNYIYASDMATAGAMPNGVVRFNLADGTATRFGNVDFTELSIGLDGKLYALAGATSTVYVYDPISTALLNKVALPSADYRGVVADANGDLYTVAWNNVISHFNSAGVLQSSITLNGSTGAPFMYNYSDDIAIAPDGTLAIGSFSGYIARMTSAFTNISYLNTNTNNQVFVSFAPQPAQPTVSVSDTTVTSPLSGMVQAPFVVSLSAPSSSPVTVNFATANGSAAAGPDYQSASGTLTFAPGQTSQTLYINVQADPYWDPAETFTLNLSNPTGATLAKAQGTATINSSLPTPTISVNNVTVTNVASGTTQASFLVSLSEPLSDPQTFGYSTADVTAKAGSDYVAASGYVNFAPGQTSQVVTVNVIGDPYYDGPEIFDLNLLPPGGGYPFATGVATIVSGVPMPAASVNDVTVQNTASGAVATFTVSLSAPSGETTTVGYSTYGGYYQTAGGGYYPPPSNDFQSTSGTLTFAPGQTSQVVNVNVTGDPYYDGTEQFWLNLLSPTNATIARGQGTATILSTLPTPPTLSVSNPTVTNVTSGLTQATFTVSLSEPLSDPTSIQYGTSSGTALDGVDYQATAGYVTFSPGQTTQTVTVNVIGDPTYDSPETFYLNLMPVSAGGGGAPYATGTCTINSALAQPGLSVSNATVTNGTSGTTPMTFTVSLTAASGDPVTVNYATADGTAVAGTDYQAASSTLTFAPGQTSQTITVNAIGNPLYAPTRTFTVNLSSPGGAGIAQGQGTGTIVSSLTQPGVSIGGVYVTDVDSGTTPANFWVWLSSGSSVPVTVDYTTADGSAVAGTDYVAASGTLTFAPGQTGQYVSVSVIGTPNYAPGRTFRVVLSNPQNAVLGNQGGNGTIFDDAPIANIGPNTTASVGSPVPFDASGSRDLDGDPLTYTWDFGDGTTGAGLQPTHVYTATGVYTATVSVSDGSAVTTASETVTVLPVVPTASISGPSDAVRGQPRTFTFSASEPGGGSQTAPFTYQITWGDGSTQTLQGPGSGVQASHVYTGGTSAVISVTATDANGNTGPAASQAVIVCAVELQGADLVVGGTTGDDVITIQPADANGTVDVVINGQDQGTFYPTGQVVVYGQSGNDVLQVVPLNANGGTTPLALPVMLFAGSGNDTLDARGASGPTVLVGGGGNDTLYGGSGRNILIAGAGASVLYGGTADDLLIAGTTSFDNDVAALAALRAEWSRTDADYLTRIADLNGTRAGGLNGSYLLTSQTVTINGVGNDLYGNLGQDWFFAATSDRIHDLESGEIVTSLLGTLSSTAWTVNQPGFSATIPILNAAPPPGAVVSAAGLPPGLSASLSGTTITVTGTPTATGTFNTTVSLLGATGSTIASRTYTMTINAAPALGTLGGPTQWTVGRSGYSGGISTSGGTGGLTLSSQANLPPGLTAVLSAGVITFSGTPSTVGTYNNVQLTIRDTIGATASGTYSITINPVPTLGTLSTTVWTLNQPNVIGTVNVLGGTAPMANLSYSGLPTGLSATQSGNTITIRGTATTPGTYNNIHLSVQDYSLATASGTYSIIVVAPGPAVTLSLTDYPMAMTAGTSGSFTVTALDASGYVATGYRGTVYLGSSDPLTGAPTTYTFTAADSGMHSFTFTLQAEGSQWLYAKDPSGINGSSAPITVTPAALDHFAVAAPQYAASYYPFNVTVSARDAYGNTIPGYNGTVHFTSSDSAATLPADYTFTAADQGSHTFSETLQTTGTQTTAVNDSNNAGVTGTASVQDLDVIPGLHFIINPSVTATTAGSPFDVTLTALDLNNNVAIHYDGTVSISNTDHGSGVVLPANYTFTAADAGVHTFSGGVTLATAGNQSLSVVDTSTVVTGGSGPGSSSASITVNPAAVSALTISALPATVTRGATQTLTVSGKDRYGNTVTGYSGPIHFSSSDPQAVLPADTTLSGGTGTFHVVFASLGTQSLSVADTSNGALTATQGALTVNPAPAVRLAVIGFPSSTTAGATGAFSVAAIDAYGYVAPGYNGTMHFTSSDPLAVLPANVALTNGTGSFSATFKTAGVQSLTATDTANASFNGTEGSITVAPATATTLILAGFPTSTTAGVSGTATVTALDAYGNVATGYTGTAHFTSSDAQAVLPADYTFTAADAGSHAFTITFKTAATHTLSVADTTGTLSNGSQVGIAVNAAGVARLTGSAPANNIPNSGYPFFVWAVDAYGNQVRNYADTVHFTTSDPQAVLPADYTYTSADVGNHNFLATLKTVGNQTITVTDTSTPGVGSMQFNVNVQVGAATGLTLTGFPNPTTAGVAGTFTVRAYDLYGNTATGYTGTVRFTSSDVAGLLPADYTFTAADAGVHTFSATLITAGGQGLWVQDAQHNLTAAQYAITVAPAAASKLVVTASSGSTTAGVVTYVTITAQDAYGNTATRYAGTVHVSSSDAQAGLPADYTFATTDYGVHNFVITLKTAGRQTITFQDAANGFTTNTSFTVTAAAASRFVLSPFPTTTTAGYLQPLTLTALDAYGNVATGYTGTVHFTSSDAQAGLPADYTFTATDNGVHKFYLSLGTVGTQSLTVTDTATSTLTARQSGITVVAGAASKFLVSGYPATTAGTSHSFTVTVTDAYGNLVTGYRGTVRFSSSDSQAGLPASYTFTAADNGVHTFTATLKTAGSQSLTVTDSAIPSITGSQTGIAVTAAGATHFAITAPATVSHGVAFSVTVTALDAYGNVATGYLGTIHFTSSDHKGILPSDYTFVAADAGVHTFTLTFNSSGTQTLTATDTHTGSIKGSASIKVS